MPKNWMNIRQELQNIGEIRPYISLQDYIVVCNKNGISDYEKQMELSRIFHDLGLFLHFQDFYALEDILIMQNVWATDAVFAVFDSPIVQNRRGRFSVVDLESIWKSKGYEPIVHKKLLHLMMQFELCYQIDTIAPINYIIPEMLPNSMPENYSWESNGDLPLQYQYEFMPKGVLARLIVRLHKYIDTNQNLQCVWKTGVKINGSHLDCPNTYAELTEAWDNRQLMIRIHGEYSRELMSKITFEVDRLNHELFRQVTNVGVDKEKWQKMIPCNCDICKETSDKYFFNYSNLQKARLYNKDIQCQKSFETVRVNDLLKSVFVKKSNEGKKIFISYSHKDAQWKRKLVNNLAPLKNQNFISEWNDHYIELGEWDEQIEQAMNDADIFLLIITPNFLSSEYISSKEITTAYSLYKKRKVQIFPVVFDYCDWEIQPLTFEDKEFHPVMKKEMYIWLGRFQAFPRSGKPVKSYSNPQEAFVEIVNELKRYL